MILKIPHKIQLILKYHQQSLSVNSKESGKANDYPVSFQGKLPTVMHRSRHVCDGLKVFSHFVVNHNHPIYGGCSTRLHTCVERNFPSVESVNEVGVRKSVSRRPDTPGGGQAVGLLQHHHRRLHHAFTGGAVTHVLPFHHHLHHPGNKKER